MLADDNWLVLTGQSETALCEVPGQLPHRLHANAIPHWLQMEAAASAAGFRLAIASSWRGFERQRLIWNGKACGQRLVLGSDGEPLDMASLDEESLLFAMLRWSAIPGCSRHHWGTDLDIYDAAAVSRDYAVQLTPAECEGCGPFALLHRWLDNWLANGNAAWDRPYAQDRGGIAPEPWHLSCLPVAAPFERLLDETRLIDWLMTQDIALKSVIRQHWSEIFHRFVLIQSR